RSSICVREEAADMPSARTKRLLRLEHVVANAPLRSESVEAAFQELRDAGRLPASDRLAAAVLDRARPGPPRAPASKPVSLREGIRRLVEMVNRIESGELPEVRRDNVRLRLLHEAIDEDTFVRSLARLAIAAIAGAGMDVTCPLYLDEC